MATKRSRNQASPPPAAPYQGGEQSGDFTGRFLVVLREDGVKEGLDAIKASSGLAHVCNAADFDDCAVEMSQADAAEVFVLDKLNIAVVDADPTQAAGLQSAAAEDSAILAVEPERIMHALSVPEPQDGTEFPFEYLRGYRDAVNHLYASLTGAPAEEERLEAAATAAFRDTALFTWGLQATQVVPSRFSGRGIRVAVLDTGMDLDHPDFAGRRISGRSFITGEAVQDSHGHGTHCIGTALGAKTPVTGVRRYGCASGAEIFAGKVLSNGEGRGSDNGILAAINWAITQKCRVISMSFGIDVRPGESFSRVYETVAQRALRSNPGTLLVAAAGNSSRLSNGQRRSPPNPVNRPANCPSIMAVAAVDATFGIAPFSDGGINPSGGGVDIAGPGVSVFSSVPDPFPASAQPSVLGRPWPPRHHTISGTSMATPHVAGIAAMWLEANGSGTTAEALWRLLTGNARRLSLPSRDVGAGLVQAPQ